jgi:hypothetical protein
LEQAITTLADFEVIPSITIQTCELVFVNELLWKDGCVKVEVLKVDGAKACTFLQEYTVEEELEQFQGCCVGTHITRVADAVVINGDLCGVKVILFWLDFTNNHGVAYFLPLVQRDVVVVNAIECVGTGKTFGVGGLP